MKTLAIDASTKSTGIAIFQQGKLIHYECLTENSTDVYKRIQNMSNKICNFCKIYNPTDIVIEDVIPQDVKRSQNTYKALIYLQAEIIIKLRQAGFKKITLYVSSHWRKLCGIQTGPGIKREILKANSQRLVKMVYGINVNDDISDAICLGIAYIKQHKK